MKHLGDITLIHGNEIEPVDCIIGGSPCQDLSVAGKRAGLSGERSGLFMEQIRIVKEMRKRYGKPRYMVWENVPGAFSSNNGEDFRAVLEEVTRIADETAVIPRPPKGKWSCAGCVMGDGWSVAWRTHDAQFWGVPQRRRRIALVADFGGESAPEILFERESVSRDSEPGGETREGAAASLENGVGDTVWCLQGNGIDRADTAGCNGRGWHEDISYTLNTIDRPAVCYDMTHACDVIRDCGEVSPTLKARMGTGGNNVPICIGNGQTDQLRMSDKVGALNCMHDQQCVMLHNIVRRLTPLECERLQGFPSEKKWDVSKMTKDEYIAWNLAEKNIIVDAEKGVVYGTRGPGGIPYKEPKQLKGSVVNGYNVVSIRNGATKLQCRVHRIVWISQNGIIPEGYCIDHINNDKQDNRISNLQIMTPSENSKKAKEDGLYAEGLDNKATKLDPDLHDELCYLYEFSDLTQREIAEIYGVSKSRVNQIIKEVGWTDIGDWIDTKGKKHKAADAPRYKALGNSIALPFWDWMLRRMSEYLPTGATMGSLFDGIGGFPLLWEKIHGAGTARWASEIEEFAIAVTKIRFPEGME